MTAVQSTESCWTELVFLHVLKRKAHISFLYSMRHAGYFDNKGLYIDRISSSNYVIKGYPKIVCHAMLNFTTLFLPLKKACVHT